MQNDEKRINEINTSLNRGTVQEGRKRDGEDDGDGIVTNNYDESENHNSGDDDIKLENTEHRYNRTSLSDDDN